MILRIEDTDEKRSSADSEAAIFDGLKWCGICWDEGPDVGGSSGPYRQSDRVREGIYQKEVDKLVADGKVYQCFLTPAELDAMRADAEKNEQAFVVDSPWAHASQSQVQEMLKKGEFFVYRFRVPRNQQIVVQDLVLGQVEWNSDNLGGDFIIVRGNGVPMYNFGVVVDDSQMGITHVFRAQEHLMNTPRQVLIYQALGLTPPSFGHMPLILAPDRSKLSKRHGAVAVGEYQRLGYLPTGLVNYLAQLGWNDGSNQEIYQPRDLIQAFSLDRMTKVAAIFEEDKFKWVNAHHIRLLSDEDAAEQIGRHLCLDGVVAAASGEFVLCASRLLRDRISTLAEASDELRRMLEYRLDVMLADERFRKWIDDGSIKETAKCIVKARADGAFDGVGRDADVFKKLASRIGEERGGVKRKALLTPLRLCLTASNRGPDMAQFFGMLSVVDSNVLVDTVSLDERIRRLQNALGL